MWFTDLKCLIFQTSVDVTQWSGLLSNFTNVPPKAKGARTLVWSRLRDYFSINVPRLFVMGVIHKPRGQIFGHFDPPSPSMDKAYLLTWTLIRQHGLWMPSWTSTWFMNTPMNDATATFLSLKHQIVAVVLRSTSPKAIQYSDWNVFETSPLSL